MLARARAFVFYFNTERNAVYCVLYVFLFILYNTVFFIVEPWLVQREAARAPGSTATSTRTAERRLSAASRHEAALGRRSQRGEALDGDAAAAAVSARAAIARGKLRVPP